MKRVMVGILVLAAAIAAALVYAPTTATVINATGVLTVADGDGDTIPDALEQELCDRTLTSGAIATAQAGRCLSNRDWLPPTVEQTVFVPTNVVPGPDLDSDALPAYVKLDGKTLYVNPFATPKATLTPATGMLVDLDQGALGDDSDKETPVLSTVKVSVPIPLGVEEMRDGDRDDLPAAVLVKMVFLTIDRASVPRGAISFTDAADVSVEIDADDADASQPVTDKVTVPYVPTNVWHDGDADNDLVPHALTIDYATVTVDRTTGAAQRLRFETGSITQALDENDAGRSSLVPWSLVDDDADFVPDAAEPVFCKLEKQSDPADGRCAGDDYYAVAGVLNPWNFRAT